MKVLQWAAFLRALYPALIDLARFLFERHHGRADLAKADITRVKDRWANYDNETAAIDAETQRLREQGK
jgi:hypothetical protein